MSHLAIHIGLSGREFYLARVSGQHVLVTSVKQARRFRSHASAEAAVQDLNATYPPAVQRNCSYRIEELTAERGAK